MPVEVNRESGRFPRKHCPFGPLGALHIISLRRGTVLYMMALERRSEIIGRITTLRIRIHGKLMQLRWPLNPGWQNLESDGKGGTDG